FLAGFLIACAGEALRLWAAGTIKKNRELARVGPYALVRHPLYLGSFLILAGMCLASTSPHLWARSGLLWALAMAGLAYVYRHKMADEEAGLRESFGSQFDDFERSTPAFWPDPSRLDARALKDGAFDLALALKNKEHHTVAGLLAAAAALWFKLVYQF